MTFPNHPTANMFKNEVDLHIRQLVLLLKRDGARLHTKDCAWLLYDLCASAYAQVFSRACLGLVSII